MKSTNKSWRIQTGACVKYAHDRVSGKAVVLEVIRPARLGFGDGDGTYLIEDIDTKAQLTVQGSEIVLVKST